ncbi:MAG: MG2 domain-containing protein, partial [Dehalococcoidia bacterium]|nr:MG2 domain-containing protein [Dehalococcoidia bacterium]
MKSRIAITAIMLVALLGTVVPACTPRVEEAADGYVAVVPAVLQAGSPQAVSVALFKGQSPAAGRVTVALLKDGKEIALSRSNINGKGTIQLNVPAVPEGEYQIVVQGASFQDEAKVKVENNFLVFVETDKPIYKPGQTIHIRVLTLNSELKPVTESVTVEVMDAKGTKIFRSVPKTDDYGIANVDLPISTEPNLGVWKINAVTPKAKTQLDVRVEEYVLPKYEIKVNLPKEWFLPNEVVKGKVAAEYSFGKPVKGDLEIKATRYVGQWQQYATFNVPIDAEAEFTIPAAGYVAGVPAAGGQGNVRLDFTVVEKSTGYQEKTSKLLTVAQSSLILQIIPSGAVFKPGLPFSLMVISKAPDNKLVDTQVRVRITYFDKDLKQIGNEEKTVNTSGGKALLEITPKSESVALSINASAPGASADRAVEAGYSPTGNFIHLEQISQGVPNLGDKIRFKVYSTSEAVNFYYEVVSRGRVVFTDYTKGSELSFATTPQMAPSSRLLVYQILPNAEVAADYLPFKVNAEYPQKVKLELSSPEAKPGDELKINVETEGEARVGIAAVDKSVFILAENRLNLQQVFDELEKLYMKPQAELHEVDIFQGVTSRGAKEIFRDAGVIVMTSK